MDVAAEERSGGHEHGGTYLAENGGLCAGGSGARDAVAAVSLRGGRFQLHAGGGRRIVRHHLVVGSGVLRAPPQARRRRGGGANPSPSNMRVRSFPSSCSSWSYGRFSSSRFASRPIP